MVGMRRPSPRPLQRRLTRALPWLTIGEEKANPCHARRAARRLGLLLPAGLLAAGGPRGARRPARRDRARARGPRRALGRPALLQGGSRRGDPPPRRRRAEPRGR